MSDLGHVLILAGGLSPEREVSLRSGARLRDALREAGVDADTADAGVARPAARAIAFAVGLSNANRQAPGRAPT